MQKLFFLLIRRGGAVAAVAIADLSCWRAYSISKKRNERERKIGKKTCFMIMQERTSKRKNLEMCTHIAPKHTIMYRYVYNFQQQTNIQKKMRILSFCWENQWDLHTHNVSIIKNKLFQTKFLSHFRLANKQIIRRQL